MADLKVNAVIDSVVLFRRDGAVAVCINDKGLPSLPLVESPMKRRTAESILEALWHDYGLEAVYLRSLKSSRNESGELHIAQVREPFVLPTAWQWHELIDVESGSTPFSQVFDIRRAHQLAMSYSSDYPYAQLGWFDKLFDWTGHVLAQKGLELTGRYKQINGGRAFLSRFETTQTAVWFKAPGTVSLNEWKVTPLLAQAAPQWLPEVIDTHADWRGWLSKEVGQSLYQTTDPRHFRLAAECLAQLQAQLQERTEWLLSIGAHDQRISFLRSQITPFIEMISRLMTIQAQTPPRVLTRIDLNYLSDQLADALSELEHLGFPNSIIHGDITPGSIVADCDKCAFIDWSRAYVGFPPICCELMLNKFVALLGAPYRWRGELWSAYLAQWPGYENAFKLEYTELSLALVSLFSYVLTRSDVNDLQHYWTAPAASYVRSLSRRMFSIAEKLVREKE
jgi:hypothetical protein